MCVPFLHYHIARPNTSTSTILRWHCLLQHRSSFWGQLHVWPKSEASSTWDPLAVLGFGVTLICCCFSVESSHDQKYQQRMDGGSFLHWKWQVWMVSMVSPINEYRRKNQHQLNLRKKHGKLETIWHRASPEAGGFCSNQKYAERGTRRCGKRWFSRRRLDPFGMVKTCEDHFDHFGCVTHLRLRTTKQGSVGNSKFSDGQRAIQQHNYSQDTAVKRLLYDTVWN